MFRELPRDKIHALLHEATALVNSSVNEGMAGAILEVIFEDNGFFSSSFSKNRG